MYFVLKNLSEVTVRQNNSKKDRGISLSSNARLMQHDLHYGQQFLLIL